MNQWSFVLVAYGLAGLATIGLLAWACAAMRKAESAVDALKSRQQ